MDDKKIETITIHHIKGNNYQHVHVDGASGSITPAGYINIIFYNERSVLPKATTFKLNDDGTLGDALNHSPDSKEGIVREYDFGIFMDINTCKSLKELLDKKIEDYNQFNSESK